MFIDTTFIYAALALFGLCMGSFAGATVWRLRAKQLIQDKREGEPVDREEYKQLLPLTKVGFKDDRSRCLHCGHELAWFDLLPLLSWSSTLGKCRYCGKRIGNFEPLIELSTALFFILSSLLWPLSLTSSIDVIIFTLWLISGVLFAILFSYDLKWFLLPNKVVFPLIGIGVAVAVLELLGSHDPLYALISLLSSIGILSGLYLVLWYVSKGEWIGFGDVKLGLAIALLLGDWRLAFLALLSANLVGSLIVIPSLLVGKMKRTTHVPFGPLLIVGGILAMLFGKMVIGWYMSGL